METEETMEKSGKVIAGSDCNWISKRTIEWANAQRLEQYNMFSIQMCRNSDIAIMSYACYGRAKVRLQRQARGTSAETLLAPLKSLDFIPWTVEFSSRKAKDMINNW